jgi:hypothetical protein
VSYSLLQVCRGRNPKPEGRNPKNGRFNSGLGFRPSAFGFVVLVTFATGFRSTPPLGIS